MVRHRHQTRPPFGRFFFADPRWGRDKRRSLRRESDPQKIWANLPHNLLSSTWYLGNFGNKSWVYRFTGLKWFTLGWWFCCGDLFLAGWLLIQGPRLGIYVARHIVNFPFIPNILDDRRVYIFAWVKQNKAKIVSRENHISHKYTWTILKLCYNNFNSRPMTCANTFIWSNYKVRV